MRSSSSYLSFFLFDLQGSEAILQKHWQRAKLRGCQSDVHGAADGLGRGMRVSC